MERFRQLGKRLGVAQAQGSKELKTKRCLATFLKGRAGEGSAGDGDGSESREAHNITDITLSSCVHRC